MVERYLRPTEHEHTQQQRQPMTWLRESPTLIAKVEKAQRVMEPGVVLAAAFSFIVVFLPLRQLGQDGHVVRKGNRRRADRLGDTYVAQGGKCVCVGGEERGGKTRGGRCGVVIE